MKMYAIKNCDTVKKARKWLDDAGIAYEFHDYKKDGVDEVVLRRFVDEFGWETVLNRAGMTWRKLDDAHKATILDVESAVALMREKPSIIKRPIIDMGAQVLVGFKKDEWEANRADMPRPS